MTAMVAIAFSDRAFNKTLGIAVVAASPGTVDLPILPHTKDTVIDLVMESEGFKSRTQTREAIDNLLEESGLSLDRISNVAGMAMVAQMLNPDNQEHKELLTEVLENAGITKDEMRRYTHNKGGEHIITKSFMDKSTAIGVKSDSDKTPWQRLEEKARSSIKPGHRTILGVDGDEQNIRRASFVEKVTEPMSDSKNFER